MPEVWVPVQWKYKYTSIKKSIFLIYPKIKQVATIITGEQVLHITIKNHVRLHSEIILSPVLYEVLQSRCLQHKFREKS